MGARQWKVAKKISMTKAEMRALEAEKVRLQKVHEEETARTREEAERRAPEVTAAALEEAEKKIKPKTPPEGSCADNLQRLFQGDSTSRMKLDLDSEDLRTREGSSCAPRHCPKGKGRTPQSHRGLPRGTPRTPTPSSPAVMRMNKTAGIAERPRAAGSEWPEQAAEKAAAPFCVRMERAPHLPTAAGKEQRADPCRGLDLNGETWTLTTTWDPAPMPADPASGMDPGGEELQMADCFEDPQAEDLMEHC